MRSVLFLAAVAAMCASSATFSQARFDYAQVVDVQPIYGSTQIDEQRCYVESSPRYAQHYRRRDDSSVVLGGIIGGVIGNQFGRGNGRAAATIAGVALGSAIAADDNRYHSGYAYQGHEVTEVCEQPLYRNQVVGYDVRYDYHGQYGQVRTGVHPGEQIRVQVGVIGDEYSGYDDRYDDGEGNFAADPYYEPDPYENDAAIYDGYDGSDVGDSSYYDDYYNDGN